jgi:hypothetical protein
MADKWPRSYKSAFGPEPVSFPQLLAEQACQRKAALRKEKLAPRFWLGSWAKEFRAQLMMAYRVLKAVPEAAVRAAWNSTEGRKCTSLGSEYFRGLAQREAKRQSSARERGPVLPEPLEVIPSLPPAGVPFIAHKSVVERLREIE